MTQQKQAYSLHCPNCGVEAFGKFYTQCGNPLQSINSPEQFATRPSQYLKKQERTQVAEIEYQKFLSGEDFYDEPENYEWCDAWTSREDRKVIDPVSGESHPIYILCARANRMGDCELYEPKD